MGTVFLGDFRVNQHHGLVAMHTVWLREHNRVARILKENNPNWQDKRLFNEARRIGKPSISKIFLFALLGHLDWLTDMVVLHFILSRWLEQNILSRDVVLQSRKKGSYV